MKDSLYWLENVNSITDLGNILDEFLKKRGFEIQSCLFLFDNEDPIKLFKNWNVGYDITFKELNKESYFYLTEFEYEEKKGIGYFFRHPDYKNVFVFLTFEKSKIFNHVLQKFFNKHYPQLSRIFLTSFELEQIIKSIEDFVKERVFTKWFVTKRKYINPASDVKYKKQEIYYKHAFIEAKESNQWVSSLRYSFKHNDRLVSGYISRNGVLKYSNGHFFLFFSKLLDNIAKISEDRLRLFSDKARKKEEDYIAKPLLIEFEEELFDTKEKISDFVKNVFEKIPYSSYSIMHLNPYLQLSFNDFKDGSSYDLWIVSRTKMFITPQLRATYSSLMNLCNNIFERFKEGKIKEAKL